MCEQGGRIATLSPEGDVFDLMGGALRQRAEPGRLPEGARGGRDPRRPTGATLGVLADPALVLGVSPQPDVLKAWGAPGFRGRGLLARFLYALPESPLGPPGGASAARPGRAPGAVQEHVQALLDACAEVSAVVPVMGLTEDARETLYAFADDLEPRLGPYGDLR